MTESYKYKSSMDLLLNVLAVICLVVGIVGCVVPLLPGLPICFVGMLLAYWAGGDFTTETLVTWGVISLVVTVMDNFLPIWFTKKFGGSKQANWGATIGIIVGFFFLPIGILLGPFFGALIGELIHDSSNSSKAFKVAFGSFASFVFGTGLKLVAAVWMAFPIFKAIF